MQSTPNQGNIPLLQPHTCPYTVAMNDLTQDKAIWSEAREDFFHDILEGLSVFYGSAFITDILATISQHQTPTIGHALNYKQVKCKKWLIDKLGDTCGTEYGTIYILGGWYAVLAAMLLHDPRLVINKVVSIDMDSECKPISEALNRTHVNSGKFESVTADILSLDYTQLLRGPDASKDHPDLVINTSCEHLSQFDTWFANIPPQTLLALQSNDYFSCDEHVNCVEDLDALKQQAPLSKLIYQGQMKVKKYTRFMLIGKK